MNKDQMKSLIPKGAKSTFVTSEKNTFRCASLYTRLWKTQYLIYNIFVLLANIWNLDQKCVLKVGGKLNNVVISVTRFGSKMDLAPFGIKLFKYTRVKGVCFLCRHWSFVYQFVYRIFITIHTSRKYLMTGFYNPKASVPQTLISTLSGVTFVQVNASVYPLQYTPFIPY